MTRKLPWISVCENLTWSNCLVLFISSLKHMSNTHQIMNFSGRKSFRVILDSCFIVTKAVSVNSYNRCIDYFSLYVV